MEEDNITPDVVEDVAPPQEPVQEPVQEPAQEPENVYDRADMFGRNIRLDFGDPAEQRGQRRLTTEAEQNYEARRDYINSEVHGLGSFVDRVVISDNMLHEAAVAIMEDTPKRDESFKWTGDSWGKAIQDVPEDFHHEIREAESWAEAEKIKADIQYRLKIEEGLAEYGGWGTVGRMGLAMTDPIFLAAMLATEGAVGATLGSAIIRSSTARSIVAKASELSIGQQAAYKTVAHIAKTGARVGVGMGGATAVHAGLSPMIDLDDVPTAMLHGAMFGGVLGIAGRTFSPLVRRYRVPSKTYQMTAAQFERRAAKGKVEGTHLETVEQAFKDGNKKIPEHVMMEYPELVAKYVGEKEATALRHAKAALDLRGYKGKQPMDVVEYLADLRDPLAPTGPSLASRISRKFKLRDAEGKFKQAEVEFKDAKKAYEDTIGEPWEKVEPFLDRQRAAEVKLKEAKVELEKVEFKIESLRDSVDALVKDIVENPDKQKGLMGEDVAVLLDFLEFKFGSRSKLTQMGGRTRVGASKLHTSVGKDVGFDRNTMRRVQKRIGKYLTKKQNKIVKDVLDFEARRLEVHEGKLSPLEKELNTATKEARLQGEKGDRALAVARKRQSRKMMEVKRKRDAAQKEVEAAEEKYVEVLNEPRAKLTEKYNKQLKENLIADIAAGKPIPAKALEHFPELRKMEGVKTYAEAKKAAEAKDEMNLSEESIEDINKTIPDEALKPIEPIEPPLDPEIQALKDKLLGPSYVEQTVKSIENALAERGLPKSKKVDGKMENKQQKLDRLEAHDTAVLFDNYRDMQKLIKNLKKQGFKPTNKNRGKADLVEQLKEFREQVKNTTPKITESKTSAVKGKVDKFSIGDVEVEVQFKTEKDKAFFLINYGTEAEKIAAQKFMTENQVEFAIENTHTVNRKVSALVKAGERELLVDVGTSDAVSTPPKPPLDLFSPIKNIHKAQAEARVRRVFIEGEDGAVISAANPSGRVLSTTENTARMNDLKADLDALGYKYTDVNGVYGKPEPSLFIEGITEGEAVFLSEKYGQEAVLTHKGFLYTSGKNKGKITPSKEVLKDASKETDFFSEIQTVDGGFKFSLELDFNAKMPTFKLKEVSSLGEKSYVRKTSKKAEKGEADAGRVDSEGFIQVIHYGEGGLTFIDPKKHGKSKGAEARRKGGTEWVDKSYFGLEGYKREPFVLGHIKYISHLKLSNLYNLNRDPLNVIDALVKERGPKFTMQADYMNVVERRLKDMGYKGFFQSKKRVAVVWEPVRVSKNLGRPKVLGPEEFKFIEDIPKAEAPKAEAPKVEAKKVKGPEPEPVSDAVALGKFETQAPHAGMPWWREWFGKRFFTSFTAEVGSSKTFGPLRWIGEQSLQDSIAKLDSITGRRIPTSMAGQTRAEMQTYGMFHELGEVYQIGYTKWRQEMGVSSTARIVGEAENKFGSLVADAVRDTYKGKDVNVIQTAEAVRKTLKQLDEHMVKEGLTEKVFDDPNYFPRKILPSHVSNLLHKAELGALDTFVADAIKSGYEKEIARLKLNPKEAEAMRLTPEEAQVIADIYLTNINTRNFAVDYNNNGFLGDNSALVLGEYLDKLGIKPEVREQILKKTKVTKEATSERFLQHRLLLDEGHMAEVLGKDGQLFTVKMTDFFDNNAKRVMNSHIRQVHGAIQSRKIGLKFNEIRGLSNAEHPRPATWREMGDFIQRTAIKEGRSPVEIQNMADQMRRMRDAVGGFTTEKTSELSMMARLMQKFAGATYGGSFGLAAIAEMGQPMAHTSIKAFMAHIGELPKIVNDFRTGKISGELQKELAMLTGVGTEGRFFREVSTMLEHHPLGTGEQMSKFETVVGNLQNGAFKIGLLTSIDAIQRQYAGMLFAQEMLNGALKGQSSYSATRLAQIGLSPEMTTTIFKYIKKHAKFEGKGNNKLHSFNFKDWAGAEGRDAAAAIQDAIVLHTKKTIHQTHVGQLPRIMQNPLGRLLMQFRNFTIGSYETQLLSNLQAADARAVTSMTTNTFFGLLSYIAIIHVKYGGNQEMLEKYLTPSELAKGAFFRSGYATHLPAVIDTMYQFAGEQAPFNHGRSSGLATGFLSFDSTPVGSLVDGVFGVGKGILASTFNDDYKYSEQDYRKIRKLIPYQNAIGFAYLHGKIGEAFPEKSKE